MGFENKQSTRYGHVQPQKGLVLLQKIWRGLCIFVATGYFFVILAPPALVAFFVILAPPALVALPCACAALTVYRATVVNAVNNIAAIIMNDICFCIRLRKIEIYIRVFYKMHLSSSVFFRKTILSSGLKGYQTY